MDNFEVQQPRQGYGEPIILEPHGTEVSTAAGGARRYRKPLRSICWRDIKCIVADSVAGWSEHNAPRLGAALSFYTLLSIAPLLLVLVAVVSLALGRQSAEADVIEQVRALAGPVTAKTAASFLNGSHAAAHGIIATIFGLATLLFGASAVMIELRDALNTIWDVPTPHLSGFKLISGFVKDRLFSFALVLAVGFLLTVSLVVNTWISALGKFTASILPATAAIIHVVSFVVPFLVITGLFSAIYKIMPDTRIEWEDVLLGGAVTSLLFSIGNLALGIYLGKVTFTSTYGAAASLIVLVLWVYYSAQIFFLGAEFTKVFGNRYGSQPSRYPEALVIESGSTAPLHLTPPEKPGL